MALFSLKNVSFKGIIHYPDIEIPEKLATFICGESGCGKSTLLKLLNGVVSPDTESEGRLNAGGIFGEILYNGKPVSGYDPVLLRREVLLCGQSAFLFDGTIAENFTQYYSYRDLPPINAEEIQEYLKICAATFPLDAQCATMSGGEKQRVFTAICLSMRPKVLLLDEPTSALDDITADTLFANIKAFCFENEMTLIVVSHNEALVRYADYTITLGNGAFKGGGRHE